MTRYLPLLVFTVGLLAGSLGPDIGPYALDYGAEVKYEVPIREHGVIVTNEGYYPKRLSIFAGEKIKFFVTSTADQPSCLLVKGKEIFLAAEKGKMAEGEAFFERPGVYTYYCPTGNIEGKITVLPKKSKVRRSVASKKVRVWIPKEE